MKGKEKHPGDGWQLRHVAAQERGVSLVQFDKSDRKMLPPEAIKTIGRTIWIYMPALFKAWKAEYERLARPVAGEIDPLLAGPNSPALEKFRTARARQEEIKLAEMEKAMVPVATIRPALLRLAAGVRTAAEGIERACGSDAVTPLRESLDEFVNELPRILES